MSWRTTISSWWARIPGSGSFRWSTFLEFLGVTVAAIAAVSASSAARDSKATADRVQAIEEERHDDERLEDLLAAQVAFYFSVECDWRRQLLAPELERYNDDEFVSADDVIEQCRDEQQFVLRDINVVGTPSVGRASALVEGGSTDESGSNRQVGVTSLEVVVLVEAGWEDEDPPIFPIISITETIDTD
jgi:hypothetical protein